MTERRSTSSSSKKTSYLVPSKGRDKNDRKSVKDSLLNFLDDCGDQDLLLNDDTTTPSPRRRTSSRGSSSHSDPIHRKTRKPSDSKRSAESKRSSSEHTQTKRTSRRSSSSPKSSKIVSEHGTPSTAKSHLKPCKEGGDESSSAGDSFADDVSHSPPATSGRKTRKGGPPRTSSLRVRQTSSDRDIHSSPREHRSSPREHRSRKQAQGSSTPQRAQSEGASSDLGVDSSPRQHRRKKQPQESRSTPKRAQSEGLLGSHLSSGSKKSEGLLGSHLSSGSRRRNSSNRCDSDNQSVASGRSTFSTISTRTGKSLGLDAGPLNAFLNAPSSSGGSVASAPADDVFLRQRKDRQQEILDSALQERWKAKEEEKQVNSFDKNYEDSDGEDEDDDDDDAPKHMNITAVSRLRSGLSMTGRATRRAGMGTVNVVRDPRRTAKMVGVFAKDVGQETFKMVMDPTLAAKNAVSLGKDMTMNTVNLTTKVGTGVAKSGLGLTNLVAKTGVNATSMVVGTAIDGAGKVVYGATGLIFNYGGEEEVDEEKEYIAKDLSSRRKASWSLMDRVSGMVDSGSSPEQEATVTVKKPPLKRGSGPSLLVPTNIISSKSSSWDF
jgi:hypothetical protein